MSRREISIGDPGSGSSMITLPPEYQGYMDGVARMNRADFQYIEGLRGNFGISGQGSEAEHRSFGRREFFLALGDLVAYGDAVQQVADRNTPRIEPIFTDDDAENAKKYDAFKKREQSRPSSGRLQNLSYLFLHLPGVKNEYMQQHAEKMVGAFPDFTASLQALPTRDIPDRHSYFVKAQSLMTDSMVKVVDKAYRPHEIDQLSWVMGYENHAFQPPRAGSYRRRLVAGAGTRTFTDLLEQVVDEAPGGHGLRTRLRDEFDKREGIGFRLMRVGLRSFGTRLEPRISKRGLNAGRRMLDQGGFGAGVCPAVFKMGNTERSIAFQYASTIVGRMPRDLPARR